MKTNTIISNKIFATFILLAVLMTSCNKDLSFEAVEPQIENQIIASGTCVLCSAIVTYPGKMTVEVEWSNSQDMSFAQSRIMTNIGDSSYSIMLNGLSKHTTYYYRITTSNSYITRSSVVGQFTTLDSETPIVTSLDLENIGFNSGIVVGNVVYTGDSEVTERGFCWSVGHHPTINGNHASYGAGTGEFMLRMTDLDAGTKYYVRAYAINSSGAGYGNELSFTTDEFQEGALNGVFSISSSDKVYFSQGNLRYQPSTSIWRFADEQYSLIHVSEDMTEESENVQYCDVLSEYSAYYSGWIDFFGWGTSGWDNGNMYYHPLDVQSSNKDYGPTDGTHYQFSLTNTYANADWGVYNSIANGGNKPRIWRSLTNDEWNWVFAYRSASMVSGVSDARFVRARVNNVYGVILFPDYYWHPSGVTLPVGINEMSGEYNNSYNAVDWRKMEKAGAVFLPASGYRTCGPTTAVMDAVVSINADCYYWTTSTTNSYSAKTLMCNNSFVGCTNLNRASGCSVRLVKDIK